jgi:hypothetical protein
MKNVFCAAIALCAGALPLLAAPDTAYQALRSVGSQRGADTLKHVIEVEGRGGVPQPVVWRVVLDDPAATGGVRELDVAHGQIVAEHTPVKAYGGSAQGALIDFTKLNLDSAGAFTVAEKEAQKAKIGFDSVDYTLRTGDDANPVWVIHMMDASQHSMGTLTLAADTGAIVGSTFGGVQPPPPPDYASGPPPAPNAPPPDNDNVYAPQTDATPPPTADDPSDTEDTHGLRIGHRIKEAFLSAGESLKNYVTGKSSSSQ